MNNEALLKVQRKISKILDEVDKIGITTEVIEDFNKLANDKLQELEDLQGSIGLSYESLMCKVYETTRYSRCYISMNYVITQEICKLNETTQKIYELLKEADNLLDAIKPLEIKESGKIEDERY